MSSRLCLPTSTMCQLAGTFSVETVLYSVPRVTSLAITTSTGSTTRAPLASALAMISRASSTRSGSARLLPTALPWASRNVFAMPPPMTSTSALSTRFLRTLILSLTLAPPMIAANGRSGLVTILPRLASSFSIRSPAYAGRSFAMPTVEACARCAVPKASFT